MPANDELLDALRQAERAIDLQVRGIERLDEKLGELLRTGMALFAGGSILGGYVVRTADSLTGAFSTSMGVGLGLNVIGLVCFVHGYVGLWGAGRFKVYSGPSPADLHAHRPQVEEAPGAFTAWVLEGYSTNGEANSDLMKVKVVSRAWGVRSLIGALAAYAAAVAVHLWG